MIGRLFEGLVVGAVLLVAVVMAFAAVDSAGDAGSLVEAETEETP